MTNAIPGLVEFQAELADATLLTEVVFGLLMGVMIFFVCAKFMKFIGGRK